MAVTNEGALIIEELRRVADALEGIEYQLTPKRPKKSKPVSDEQFHHILSSVEVTEADEAEANASVTYHQCEALMQGLIAMGASTGVQQTLHEYGCQDLSDLHETHYARFYESLERLNGKA